MQDPHKDTQALITGGADRLGAAMARYLAERELSVAVHYHSNDVKAANLVDALRDADVLVLSVRRQALPDDQLTAIREHFSAGKPISPKPENTSPDGTIPRTLASTRAPNATRSYRMRPQTSRTNTAPKSKKTIV